MNTDDTLQAALENNPDAGAVALVLSMALKDSTNNGRMFLDFYEEERRKRIEAEQARDYWRFYGERYLAMRALLTEPIFEK